MRYLFTYGTLMSGQCRNNILQYYGAHNLGEIVIEGIKLYDYSNSFPVAMINPDSSITGELYAINDDMWERLLPVLDQIESRGYMYDLFRVPFDNGDKEFHIYLGIEDFWENYHLTEVVGESPKWGA